MWKASNSAINSIKICFSLMENSGDSGSSASMLCGTRPVLSCWSVIQFYFIKWPYMQKKKKSASAPEFKSSLQSARRRKGNNSEVTVWLRKLPEFSQTTSTSTLLDKTQSCGYTCSRDTCLSSAWPRLRSGEHNPPEAGKTVNSGIFLR